MTLTSTVVRIQYNGDGSTILFPVPYVFWDDDDLLVVHADSDNVETTWTRGTEYTVTGGDGATGNVTVSTSPTDYTPASGETLTIISNLDDIQELSLPFGGPIPSEDLEEELDKIVRLIQQLDEELDRALKFPITATDTDITLPTLVDNALKYLRVNSTEDGLEWADITSSGTITIPVTIAEGGTGATNAADARTNLGVDAADDRRTTAKRLTLYYHAGI